MDTLRRTIKILVCLTALNNYPSSALSQNPQSDTQPISKLDLSNDSVMTRILEEVTNSAESHDKSSCYTVDISKFKDGLLLRICETGNAVFDPRATPVCYTYVKGRLIVFNLTFDYGFRLSSGKDTISIETALIDERPDLLDIRYYCILDGAYARYSPGTGWIWSDGKPDE